MVFLVTDVGRSLSLPIACCKLLGIPYEVAYASISGLQTRTRLFGWGDPVLRDYLRQFQLVYVHYPNDLLTTGLVAPVNTFRWLRWNEPTDAPVIYNGIHFGANRDILNAWLPEDFPLVRPDISRLSQTVAVLGDAADAYLHTGQFLRLEREGVILPLRGIGGVVSSNQASPFWWRLDNAKHQQLAAIGVGEILITPVGPTSFVDVPGTQVVAGYRYKNRYFLPQYRATSIAESYLPSGSAHIDVFWFLYGLKLCGVTAERKAVLHLAMDDALFLPPGNHPNPNMAITTRILYESYRWFAKTFFPRTGCVMQCGILTGRRYDRPHEPLSWQGRHGHWDLVVLNRFWNGSTWQPLDAETRQWVIQIHSLLLNHHKDALPTGIHDHTIRLKQNRVWRTFQRHSDPGFARAAPNDAPRAGSMVVVNADQIPLRIPQAVPVRIRRRQYMEISPPRTGSDMVVHEVDMRSVFGAMLAYETAVAEMRFYGFPDAYGAPHGRLMLSPNYISGGPAIWFTLLELGYRAVRCGVPLESGELTPREMNLVPSTRYWNGLHFLGSVPLDMGTVSAGTWGLYHPTYANYTATGVLNLDVGGDIIRLWDQDPLTARRRAYQRALGRCVMEWLQAAFNFDAVVMHPLPVTSWADPNDPTRPFDASLNSRINFLIEYCLQMEQLVRVLSDYVGFGSPMDLIELREKLIED